MTAEHLLSRITIEPNKCGSRPCIRGLRIRVQDVLEMLAEGMETKDILEDYPYLEAADIRAVLMYASHRFNVPTSPHSQ
ncbi:MAG: DUF433 domain-containing protein [Gammaproteobacteria bacterium]|nr:DUF433 domain-containing protein [Gammaproteobacteria bacterium]MBU1723030.1 DUF433 domain-containing protein [Gammaproteobacteria bacterium]MBU2003831.1 DUF433 domain-containing protein [Gammaproteobacteria bacterium]